MMALAIAFAEEHASCAAGLLMEKHMGAFEEKQKSLKVQDLYYASLTGKCFSITIINTSSIFARIVVYR